MFAGAVKCWPLVGAVTVTVGGVSGPVHETPLMAKSVGIGSAVVQVPLKPIWVLPPGAMFAFQLRFVAVTAVPDCDQFALHGLGPTCWLASGKWNVSVHPFHAVVPEFCSVSWAVTPPGHSLCLTYCTWQPIVAARAVPAVTTLTSMP